jgi:FkbM family methyltransferase
MRSYAQHGEDVRLARAFSGQSSGFYIDVGAGGPIVDSVTRHFYQQGWHGINVEPDPEMLRLLQEDRRRDVNLAVVCSDRPGERVLHESRPGLSTLHRDVAERVKEAATEIKERKVPVMTLAQICEQHVTCEIDFLKVDVESHEREVLLGADWARWRPRVVVVEAVEPNSLTPSHRAWEPMLLSAGYVRACFDGLNRFYVTEECLQLAPRLDAPITPLDQVELDRYLRRIEDLQASERQAHLDLQEARRRLVEVEETLGARYRTSLRVPASLVGLVRRTARLRPTRPTT